MRADAARARLASVRHRRGVRARVQPRPVPGRLGRARVPGRLVGAVAGVAAQDGGLAAAARRGLVAGPEGADAAPEVASPKGAVARRRAVAEDRAEPADDELRRWVFDRVSRETDLQTVTVKTITNELKAAFGGIKVKGARKALVKASIVEALAQQAAPQESESDDDEAPPSEARRLGFDDLVEDEEEEEAPVVAEAETEERPMNPYLYFSKLKRSEVRAEVDGDEAFAELSGGKRNAEATKRLGVLWKALSEEDKRRYKDEAPLIKCKKRKSTKKRKSSVEAADAPAFDPEVCRGVLFDLRASL